MAINFLIALGTAVGSAALLLTVLYICLKLIVPKAFEERIPTAKATAPQEKVAVSSVSATTAGQVSRVSTQGIGLTTGGVIGLNLNASLFSGEMQTIQSLSATPTLELISTAPSTAMSFSELVIANRLTAAYQKIWRSKLTELEAEKSKLERELAIARSVQEMLTPRGQSTPNPTIRRKSRQERENEALRGLAS